jgi:hypothetical protein
MILWGNSPNKKPCISGLLILFRPDNKLLYMKDLSPLGGFGGNRKEDYSSLRSL